MQEQSITQEITYLRRHFHQNPELSGEEYLTQEFIISYCKDFSCIIEKVKTGVLLYFDLNKEKIIGFRAEMDALPIEEKNNISFASLKDGVMHACGHDGHMAILLLVVKYINSYKNQLKNNYLLIFQPSEEKYGGSKSIAESEFYLLHKPTYLIALHVFPTLEEGKIFSKANAFLAMCCEIDIHIMGRSTHVYNIENGIDSIRIGNELIHKLYAYFDKIDKKNTRFLIGKVQGGKQRNIVSDDFQINITLRNFNKDNYMQQRKHIEEIIDNIKKKYQCQIDIGFNDDFDPVINDAELLTLVQRKYQIFKTEPKIIGDDFSQYQRTTKTGYFLLGIDSDFLHECTFNFNEKVLLNGYRFFVSLLNI